MKEICQNRKRYICSASQLTVLEYTKINYHISLTKGLSEAVSHRRTEGQRRQRPKEKG
jgi:hypothetical protein